jgi:sporulation protein YlmC with PRC-barrel domain
MTPSDTASGGDVNPNRGAGSAPAEIAFIIVDVAVAAAARRASKLIGRTVINDADEDIGHIDDLLLEDDTVAYAVLSVGGFLGIGAKLVAVPYSSLQISEDEVVLPGASKDMLKALADFVYRI